MISYEEWEKLPYLDRIQIERPTPPPRTQILGSIQDMISRFLYYDRKEDEDMPVGMIEEAIENGEVTVDEIVEEFRLQLRKGLGAL